VRPEQAQELRALANAGTIAAMRNLIAVVAVVAVVAACGKEAPRAPANELEAFERQLDGGTFRGVYVGPSGVYYDREHVASLAEFPAVAAELRRKLTDHATPPHVVLDLDAAPPPAAVELFRALADVPLRVSRRVQPTADDPMPYLPPCRLRFAAPAAPADGVVMLSLLIDAQQTWIGLSRVNEFQQVNHLGADRPDWAKLDATLNDHKASAFFSDRTDAELATEAPSTAWLVTGVDVACLSGFTDLAIVPPDQLSARPQL
jgi:hypothetical protein